MKAKPEATPSHAPTPAGAGSTRLLLVLGLVVAYMLVEVIGGLLTNSLALLADAGHMLTDAGGIGLALLATWFAGRPATAEKSYGYYRVEIFSALLNALVLLGVAAFILYEAIQRFSAPPEVIGPPMLAVAGAGLLVNLVSMQLLHSGSRSSLNLRGAYLEVLGDLLGSVAVIVAGVVILLTGWNPIDPIASVGIAALILPRTWSLLREAVDILLQATPKGVRLEEVRRHILEAADVADVHDLHAWTLTSGMNVVSAHVVMCSGADAARVLNELCDCLTEDFDMEHSTIQLESGDRRGSEHAVHD